MRISQDQEVALRQLVIDEVGSSATLRLFGSRLNNDAKGGDVDLFIELDNPVENPALLSAQIASQAMRIVNGRNVDVVISAPNLQELPIHRIARRGRLL